MSLRLLVFAQDYVDGDSFKTHYRLAVVDLNKAKTYPSNFVCLLPMQINGDRKTNNVFFRVFGDKSLEQAKALLTEALKGEDEPEIKAEIKRRLKLLEPKVANQACCSNCGKIFESKRARRFKRNYCPDCMNKKYGNRF